MTIETQYLTVRLPRTIFATTLTVGGLLGQTSSLAGQDHAVGVQVDFPVAPTVTDAIGHPNGLALSADGATLYVAQIFGSLRPLVIDDRVWALPLEDGQPAGLPEVIARLGAGAANDGLALDELGRIYVAANGAGQIWRIDPTTRETVLVAEGMPGVASLAFGAGEFDGQAIYATSTRTGRVWKVKVGVRGAPLHR